MNTPFIMSDSLYAGHIIVMSLGKLKSDLVRHQDRWEKEKYYGLFWDKNNKQLKHCQMLFADCN